MGVVGVVERHGLGELDGKRLTRLLRLERDVAGHEAGGGSIRPARIVEQQLAVYDLLAVAAILGTHLVDRRVGLRALKRHSGEDD